MQNKSDSQIYWRRPKSETKFFPMIIFETKRLSI